MRDHLTLCRSQWETTLHKGMCVASVHIGLHFFISILPYTNINSSVWSSYEYRCVYFMPDDTRTAPPSDYSWRVTGIGTKVSLSGLTILCDRGPFHERFCHRNSNSMEISFCAFQFVLNWSLQNFAYATIAVLSWHVQFFVTIRCHTMDLHQDQISMEFELRWKNRSWNGPWPECVNAINLTNCGMGKNIMAASVRTIFSVHFASISSILFSFKLRH